jgi:hypothetical protein
MKHLFLITFFISNISIAQNSVKSVENYTQEITKSSTNDTIVEIYSSDLKSLDEILNKKNKIIVVYSFSILCKNSRERFPIIKEVLENKKNVELIIVVTNRFNEMNLIESYFKRYKYYSPVFILDTAKYGNSKDPSKRNDLMVQYLCKDCDPNKMGFSDFFIKSTSGEILYKSAYETTIDEMKTVLSKFE